MTGPEACVGHMWVIGVIPFLSLQTYMGVDQYSWPPNDHSEANIIFLVVLHNGHPMYHGPFDQPPYFIGHRNAAESDQAPSRAGQDKRVSSYLLPGINPRVILEDEAGAGRKRGRRSLLKKGRSTFGAFFLDVRTLAFCQLMGFPLNHQKLNF